MGLPYKVDDLESVPEEARELYEPEDSGGFRLPVDGVKADTGELDRAYEKTKQERDQLKRRLSKLEERAMSPEEIEELEALREEKRKREEEAAKAEGRWEDLRERLEEEHSQRLQGLKEELSSRDQVIENLTVTSELRDAIVSAGVKSEYVDAVEAMLSRKGPKVKWDDGTPKGVFPDELHGDVPISEFVASWAESDQAEPYMPPSNAGGGGGTGQDDGRGSKITTDKPYDEMTQAEKAEYLEKKYGQPAA